MQKHNDAMKTSGHSLLEKYTSHFIERVVCERELETEQNCNLLTPTLMVITAFSFPFSWLLNPGPGALRHGPHSSIFSPTDLNSNCSLGSPEDPLCWVLVLSTASDLQLTLTSCRRGYMIIWHPLFFLRASQFRTQFNPSTVKVISWYSLDRMHLRCISYFDSLAGSEVNMQH